MDDHVTTSFFLNPKSKVKLGNWLSGIVHVPGVNPGRLGMLQCAGTDYITLIELVRISDFMYPQTVSDMMQQPGEVQ